MVIPALKKTYNGKTVLDIPETTITDGSITAICGHNGSGKTTLGKILAGIIKDDSSSFSHHDIRNDSGSVIRDIRVGYMNQTSFPFRMSVRKNLLLNADKNLSGKEKQARADMLLSALGLSDTSSKNSKKLSGGQTQRMALGGLLMKDYDLLILDEPTASIDRESITAAEKAILDYKARTGCTIILITHSADQADRLADSVITFENGRITGISHNN